MSVFDDIGVIRLRGKEPEYECIDFEFDVRTHMSQEVFGFMCLNEYGTSVIHLCILRFLMIRWLKCCAQFRGLL